MIQVIQRVFTILEELNRDGTVTLEALVRITQLNKGTLCNILRSLIELQYVQRIQTGHYALTEKINTLHREQPFPAEDMAVMQQAVDTLAAQTQESGVLTRWHNQQVEVVCQAQYQRTLMINTGEVYAALSLFHSTSGRILLAGLSAAERQLICQQQGYPGSAWANINTTEALEDACCELQKTQLCIMENFAEEIIAFSVPVRGPGRQNLALGLTMPLERSKGRNKKIIIAQLKKCGAELSNHLKH